jgi:hypothetical protein
VVGLRVYEGDRRSVIPSISSFGVNSDTIPGWKESSPGTQNLNRYRNSFMGRGSGSENDHRMQSLWSDSGSTKETERSWPESNAGAGPHKLIGKLQFYH